MNPDTRRQIDSLTRVVPAFILIFCFALSISIATAQDEDTSTSSEVIILSQNTDQFPEISIDVLVKNNGQVVSNLSETNFLVDDPQQDFTVEAIADRSLATFIIVDLSAGGDLDLIQNTLRAYLNDLHRSEDTLTFYLIDDVLPRQITVASGEDPQPVIDSLALSNFSLSLLNGLDVLLGEIDTLRARNPGQATQVILVGSYLFARLSDTAVIFGERNIPIYAIQAHQTRQSSTQDFNNLAATSGGLFVDNQNGRFVTGQGTVNVTSAGDLAALFRTLEDNRLRYHITYRSVSQDLQETRNIQLTTTLPSEETITSSFSYSPNFMQPLIEIIAPTNLNPIRVVDESGDFSIDEEQIVLRVDFPDQIERDISRVRLEVLEPQTGDALQVALELSDMQINDDGNLLIPWSLQGFSEVGSTYQLVVKVSVIDEIGLLAEYSLPATITVRGAPQVAALGQTFTPQPTFTPQVTFTPQPTFTQPATLIAAPTESEPSSVLIPSASQDLDRIILAVLGILIINLIGLSMFLLRTTPGRRFARQGVKAARTAVYRARTGIFQNREKAGQTIGTLTVQKGIKGVKTITINRSRFIVGRQIAAGCNYEIPFEFVSSQHFTIFFRNDRFSIMDMNSANGTRLNGRRLRPSQHVPLQNGATIAIVDRVVLEFKTDIKTADEPIIKTEPIAPILADEAPPARGAAGLRPAFSENQNPVEDDPQQKSKRQTANWESLGGSDPNDISGDWDPFKKD